MIHLHLQHTCVYQHLDNQVCLCLASALMYAAFVSLCEGPVGAANLYSPEAQLSTSPLIIGYLNGVMSLVDRGLTRCVCVCVCVCYRVWRR